MDIKKAKKIVSALADGIDPITGEILPTDHLCNNPDIVRAFYTLLHMNIKSNNISAQNAGKPWTLEDDNELRNMYENVDISSARLFSFIASHIFIPPILLELHFYYTTQIITNQQFCYKK